MMTHLMTHWFFVMLRATGCAIGLLFPISGAAEPLARPAGEIILTITGVMHSGNTPEGAIFDLALLESLGTASFETSTQWTEGVAEFKGVSLHRLLDRIGADPAALEVIAINEYQIEVPASDAVEGGPILAWQQSGKLLSVREKGPLWLIYPYDMSAAYRTEKIYARSVWQVLKINLLP